MMRPLMLALALAGCRQLLGVPDEGQLADPDDVSRYEVTVDARGIVDASGTISIELALTDGTRQREVLTTDARFAFEVSDGLGYTITAPSICMTEHASGTIMGGPATQDVAIACDGLAALTSPGFSAPVTLQFSSSDDSFDVHGSFLVQETRLTPVPRHAGGSIVVELDGAMQSATDGTWGPLPFDAGATLELVSSYPPSFVRPYTFTLADAPLAPFGHGKPATPRAGSRFGASVAADQDLLVVGAPGPSDQSEPGRAYVFRRTGTTWVEEAVLQAPSPSAGDNFGASIAVRDQRVLVGAPRAGAVVGSAYVFVRSASGWSGTPVAATAGDRHGLGAAVAIGADHILVGAPRESSEAGAVYQFGLDGAAPLTFAAGVDAGDRFGASIAVTSGIVVIGAPGEASSGSTPGDNSYPGAGAAYIYTGGPGSMPTYLKPPAPAPAPGDAFGSVVATNGTLVVVGAPAQDSASSPSTGIDPIGMVTGGAPQSGAVFMWRKSASTWTFAHVLKAPNAGSGDGFGTSVSLVRNVLAIGAPFEDSASATLGTANETRRDAGAAYVYRVVFDDITEMPAYIKAAAPGVDDAFGDALSLSLESLIVGAPYDSSTATGWNGSGGDGADSGAVTSYR